MNHTQVFLAAALAVSCTGPSGPPWYELPSTGVHLTPEGLVVNRLQVQETSIGGGESTTISRARVELWHFDGAEPTRTITKVTTGDLMNGHVWVTSSTGLLRDDVQVAAIDFAQVKTTALGVGPDGGVVLALLQQNDDVRVWSDGDSSASQLMRIPELSVPWPRMTQPYPGPQLMISSGPRFGVVLSRGSDGLEPEVPTLAWAQGGAATTLAAGEPIAFWAGVSGTRVVLRKRASGQFPLFEDTLFDETGSRVIGRVTEPIGTEANSPVYACHNASFDPSGKLLSLIGRAQGGFTLEVGGTTLDVPSQGSTNVRRCEVLSDGNAIHVVWFENQIYGAAPNPLILRHVLFVNGEIKATHRVDLTPDLLP